ncbi:lipoprotein-anchoring transpeptidase ErfK/SrfK [Rhizobium sp. PP-F2F-G38]|uniref:L,D-transpeptidase n=1 Tax=Ferranicluibacter rubi TaxID=2715133 RepID=A0AA43ZL23_9HYPH|nr:L,D-transpeptidase [Ferranicluibacter rubi]NHT78817.1 L,D-transpeptidase [Ferranicluibacter rubi]PYE35953.1 lipoprotein-anchoring transpeptidase ErfK/SrfK [Rhizobium sp. PP-WC-1G-195]PYE99448.1 lipoprotein-anchoring transpeptidase ErfK/SrfK [Rhizobium sp. PP-F2F-G38]
MSISRRGLLLGFSALLAGCADTGSLARLNYAALPDERFPLPAVPLDQIEPELRRQEVAYVSATAPGTIVVDTPARRLYYVLDNGRAMRYGIGVGREGYALAGNAYIGRKAEWPSWTPTPNMIRRDPGRNLKYAGGLPGGPNNPLGARAIYLYRNGNDTMFRIHGTNQPRSIGHAMSSGCVRMLNHDVVDLYGRVKAGGQVVVLQASA